MTAYEQIALKEWAGAVKALEKGEQILIMRKGGIREETRDFQVESDSFYFYPTYEHQKQELFKGAYRHYMAETLENWSPEQEAVSITSYAEVVEDIQVHTKEQLALLAPYHIWTDRFAEERLHWKRKNPLHVLVLRVYTLAQPIQIPINPAYIGCKSWLRLETELPNVERHPVLSDTAFEQRLQSIRNTLQQS
jgi:hypothetical protein